MIAAGQLPCRIAKSKPAGPPWASSRDFCPLVPRGVLCRRGSDSGAGNGGNSAGNPQCPASDSIAARNQASYSRLARTRAAGTSGRAWVARASSLGPRWAGQSSSASSRMNRPRGAASLRTTISIVLLDFAWLHQLASSRDDMAPETGVARQEREMVCDSRQQFGRALRFSPSPSTMQPRLTSMVSYDLRFRVAIQEYRSPPPCVTRRQTGSASIARPRLPNVHA